MAYKTREESNLLKIHRILNLRGNLTGEEQKYYFNLEKGYQGEVQFDLLTEKLQSNCYILNDLQLEVNNKSFQIDSTIIYEKTISIFEVKNFEGEYCYDTDYFRTSSGLEVQNPLDQLKRCTNLFRQLLQKLGYNFIIEGYVIFINPQFTLYQAPQNLPFILPTQTTYFLKKLDSKPSRVTNTHKNLADKLISLHQPVSPYSKLPIYKYEQLKKGTTCKLCHSFSISVQGRKIVCKSCGFEEGAEPAVIRNVEEIKLLFPDRKIITNDVSEWFKVIEDKKRIRRILRKNYEINGVHQWAYYK